MKSRHTWQRLVLGWKVSNELRVNRKAPRFSAFGFKRPTDENQFEGILCPTMWKQQFVFSLFSFPFLRETMLFCLCERQCCSVSARDSVPSGLCERQCLFDLCERHCCFHVPCLQYACAISSLYLFLGWLMHASHLLSHRICSKPLTMLLLHDSANQNSMSHRD